jgi:ADP-ribosylarginine hydrolase
MSIKEKIKASIFISSYLDTLGSFDGRWEFNFGKTINTNLQSSSVNFEILHHFFSLGGFSNIDISKWKSSDDTIMMIATGLGTLKGGKEEDYIDEYLKIVDKLKEEKRFPGNTTMDSLEFIRTNRTIDKLKYDTSMGGNGASMRTGIIGIINHKESDVDLIISQSITASRVTHNYSIGFLGGLVASLFANFGMRGIHFLDWFDELFKLEKKIDEFMKNTNINNRYIEDKIYFFNKLKEYKEKKIDKYLLNPLDFQIFSERVSSLKSYNNYGSNNEMSRFGASGLSSVIVAYDAILMSHRSTKYPFEKNKLDVSLDSFIFYSTLHFGDNDTTGAIAGIFYGSIYGSTNFDTSKFKQLEFFDEINKLINFIEKSLD